MDIFRLHCHIWPRSKLAIFASFVPTISLLWGFRSELITNSGLFIFLVVWCLFLGVFVILVFLLSVLNPKWRKGRIGEHAIEVSDQGISESTELNKTHISWRAIEDLRFVNNWILIRWGGEAFTFPCHSFSSESDWRKFGNEIIHLWNRNKNEA
jgi:hypothetical protein